MSENILIKTLKSRIKRIELSAPFEGCDLFTVTGNGTETFSKCIYVSKLRQAVRISYWLDQSVSGSVTFDINGTVRTLTHNSVTVCFPLRKGENTVVVSVSGQTAGGQIIFEKIDLR